MPIHALAGHLVIITAPLTALLALVYAWRPRTRAGMRSPLIVVSALNMALAVWAETAGAALLRQLRIAAEAANQELPAITLAHAHQADRLSVASFALSVAVLAFVWRLLSPRRTRSRGTLVAACVLTACALAIGWFTATTLSDALRSVWAHHTLWQG